MRWLWRLDPRCRMIPQPQQIFMATQRVFARQRFASHAAFTQFGPVSVAFL